MVDPSYDLVVAFLANRWGGKGTGIAEVMNAVFASVIADYCKHLRLPPGRAGEE